MATCPIDGTKIGIFSKVIELKDGKICSDCGKRVGLVMDLPLKHTMPLNSRYLK